MNAAEVVNNIEWDFKVDEIEYDGIKLWPYLRISVFFDAMYRSMPTNTVRSSGWRRFRKIKYYSSLINNYLFHGLFEMTHKKGRPVLFTDNMEVRYVGKKPIDKIAHEIVEYYHGDIIPIVHFVRNRKIRAFEKYIDYKYTQWGIHFSGEYCKEKLLGREVWEAIRKWCPFELRVDIDQEAYEIAKSVAYYRKLWRRLQPEIIYINQYYSAQTMAAIFSARELDIPVVELQHGVLARDHIAYHSEIDISEQSIPNYLFCFGQRFKDRVSSGIYRNNCIKTIGSYYLEMVYSQKETIQDRFFKKYPKKDKDIIAVIAGVNAGVRGLDEIIIPFCEKIHVLSPEIRFVYVPRMPDYAVDTSDVSGIEQENDLDIYQCMIGADILVTEASTCFLEALFYGKPSILVSLERGYAHLYKNDLCYDIPAVQVVEEPLDAVRRIHELVGCSEEEIQKMGRLFFAYDHKTRVSRAISEIEKVNMGV